MATTVVGRLSPTYKAPAYRSNVPRISEMPKWLTEKPSCEWFVSIPYVPGGIGKLTVQPPNVMNLARATYTAPTTVC
jgi:hypothetical protein